MTKQLENVTEPNGPNNRGVALEGSFGFEYLDKESIFQCGDVLAVTTDLMGIKRPYEPPKKLVPRQSSLMSIT